ncbi:hypothetical protein [Sediminicoccus sp. KRV36]|uniref:hypothetical protein n=1 Tax=Sediminicoccus sp. KRV36 TaxID=3133721 RepID=UPI00200DEEC2|nr:hypothetical protein [Sediminicoccus rosea]UPY35861.1 hypothetical protein LHU95_16750 [Sediminicoccus rosea]
MKLPAAVILALTVTSTAMGQTPPVAPSAPLTEQTMERGLVNLGLMAGHAVQCLPETERPAAQQALLAFNSILVGQMGANAAFRWATSFGAGSSHEVDPQFCGRSIADWRRHVLEHRLDR